LCNFLISLRRGAVKCARERSKVPAKTERQIHRDRDMPHPYALALLVEYSCIWLLLWQVEEVETQRVRRSNSQDGKKA